MVSSINFVNDIKNADIVNEIAAPYSVIYESNQQSKHNTTKLITLFISRSFSLPVIDKKTFTGPARTSIKVPTASMIKTM